MERQRLPKRTVLNTVGLADILKLSEDEADYLFGDILKGTVPISVILREYGTYDIPIVIITQGKGSLCYRAEYLVLRHTM